MTKKHFILPLLILTNLTMIPEETTPIEASEPIQGDFFIIRTSLRTDGDFYSSFQLDQTRKSLGIDINETEPLVQVWMTSKKGNTDEATSSENWTDDSHPLLPCKVPSYLPYSLLENLKEGDLLKLTICKKPVELRASQNDYKYASDKDFAATLAVLKKRYDTGEITERF